MEILFLFLLSPLFKYLVLAWPMVWWRDDADGRFLRIPLWNGRYIPLYQYLPFTSFDERLLVDILMLVGFFIFDGFFLVFYLCSLLIVWLDHREYWMPSILTTLMMFLSLLFSPFSSELVLGFHNGIAGALFCFLVLSFSFYILSLQYSDSYSGGDVSFYVMCGAYFGFTGSLVFISCSIVFFSLHCLLTKKRNNPMGPSLFVSLISTYFLMNSLYFVEKLKYILAIN